MRRESPRGRASPGLSLLPKGLCWLIFITHTHIYTHTQRQCRSVAPAVMSSIGFDAAAFGAFVDHLSRFELQAFDEFFSRVSFRYGSLKHKGTSKSEQKIQDLILCCYKLATFYILFLYFKTFMKTIIKKYSGKLTYLTLTSIAFVCLYVF